MYSLIMQAHKRIGESAHQSALGGADRLTYFIPTSKTPGPGEYGTSSAFGHYISKHAYGSISEQEEIERSGCLKQLLKSENNSLGSSSQRKNKKNTINLKGSRFKKI